MGTGRPFPGGNAAGPEADHFHVVLRSRKCGLYLHSPISFHGVVLNYLSTGTTLPL
jgi:hypothetical protein